MPEVSCFLGIVITMYSEPGARRKMPHFHARCNENTAAFEIASGDLLVGFLPKSQRRLVETWAELRRAELEEDWRLIIAGHAPNKIDPLR